MRTLIATALIVAGIAAGPAWAQTFTLGWNPRSGDVWVDAWLGDMNRYAGRYRDPFIDELVRYHNAPRDLVVDLLVHRHWAPGDVYFACALAHLVGRPCREVADVWERDHAQGWGAVAKRMGIQPGSAQFHRLKQGMVPTYDRWGRPIELDTQLERDFPGRGHGASHGASHDDGHGRDRGDADAHGPGNGEHGRGHGKGNSNGKGHGRH